MQGLTLGQKKLGWQQWKTIRSNRSNKHVVVELWENYPKIFQIMELTSSCGQTKQRWTHQCLQWHSHPLLLCYLMDKLQKVVNRVNYHSVYDVSILANLMENENSYMREDAFDCLHERANIDNSKQGNFNNYVTNPQLCLILGKSKLLEHQKERIARAENERRRRRQGGVGCICFNPECMSQIAKEGSNWPKCKVSRCRCRSCGKEERNNIFQRHETKHHN